MDQLQHSGELIRKARCGDRDAFGALVASVRDRLEAAVRLRLGSFLRQKVDVEDVLQETYLKAFDSLASFEERGIDSFYHWLKGIAENVLLYWARQLHRRDQLHLDRDVAGSNVPPSKVLRRKERFERLQEALAGLSPEHREVILLTRVEELPLSEVVKRMGKSPQAVKALLWRAVQKLRDRFGETESLHLPFDRLRGDSEKKTNDDRGQ